MLEIRFDTKGAGEGKTSITTSAVVDQTAGEATAFALNLDNFECPFDLLLNLIATHKLDISEVAL